MYYASNGQLGKLTRPLEENDRCYAVGLVPKLILDASTAETG